MDILGCGMKIENMGVDLGTSSMGIARYAQAEDGEYYLIDVESVIFDEPVINDSKGVRTKNADRRDSRLRSRQVDRTKARHKKLRHLFPLLKVSPEDIENNRKQNPNIFQLRASSVATEISLIEFARVLAHVNNNRGYKGNLKSSGGVVNKNIKALEEMLKQENLQTIGQLWCAKQQESGNAAWKHQSAGNSEESPGTYMTRTMVEKEFHLIWDKQAEYHSILNEKTPCHMDKYFKDLPQDATLKDIFFHAIFYQRPIKWNFDTVGDCPFEEGLKRAAIAHPAFQEYRIAEKLLDIRLTKRNQCAKQSDPALSEAQILSEAQMQQLYDMLNDPSQPYNENGEISYNHIYKALKIDENLRFNIDKRADNEDNQGVKGNQSLYAFYRVGILTEFQELSQDAQDILIDFLSHQTDYNILLDADARSLQAGLKEVRSEAAKDTQIAVIRFIQESICPVLEKGKTLDLETGRASYSKKLLSILTKRLRLGETENSILQDCYGHEYTRKAPTGKLKSVNTVLTKNPIIDRVLREYKTKMDYYVDSNHMPNQLSIEVSRELKNSLAMRNFIELQQKDYQKDINEAKKELPGYGIGINGHNILRYRLWVEGDGICPYCGQNMGIEGLQAAEIDHIIPIATNGPNRYFNKVLCHSNCNNKKSNNTPYQAVEQKIINEGALESFAENLKNKAEKIKKRPAGHKWIKPLKKRDLEKKAELLLTTKTREELFDFSERQQNETAWIGKIVLDWSNDISQKEPVATRGALTAHLRHIWGIDTLLAEIRISEGKILFSKHKEKGKNTVLPPAAYEELYLNEIPENDADSYFYALWKKENLKISLKKYRQQQKSNPQYQFDKRCDHRHHAVDAAIIGLCDHSMLQRASEAGGLRRVVDNCGNEIHKGFYPENPYPQLRARLKQLLTGYVVWHKPDRFPNKAFFQESAYGVIKQEG